MVRHLVEKLKKIPKNEDSFFEDVDTDGSPRIAMDTCLTGSVQFWFDNETGDITYFDVL